MALAVGVTTPVSAEPKAPAPIVWGECDPDELVGAPPSDFHLYSCANYAVPLDHDRPRLGTINIALLRRAAENPDTRLGSLFLNPGGPGGSGYRMPTVGGAIVEQRVLDRFDLIGFDPRGVARSTPLRCFATVEDLDRVFERLHPLPRNTRDEMAGLNALRDYGRFCDRYAGPLLDHMSTKDVARDLDVLRQAVGDRKLNYVGFSYGTLLGATYVNMFPGRSRAVVLDGNVDPTLRTLDGLEYDRQRTKGFELALDAFLVRCDAVGTACAFSGNAREKYDALRDHLRGTGPITLPDGTEVTEWMMTSTVAGALYAAWLFTELAEILRQLWTATLDTRSTITVTGRQLDTLAATGRQGRADALPDTPFTGDNSYDAVNCSDKPFNHRPSELPAIADRWERQLPDFGRYLAWADPATCPTWPVEDPDVYRGPWNTRTETPVLLFGNYYDPATRYEFAKRMARQLGNAHLVSVDSFGHCILGDSTCANRIAADYLLDLKLPAPGAVCAPDAQPFPTPPEPKNN